MDIFAKLVLAIVKEQEGLIGPVALEQAKKVSGLTLDWDKKQVKLEGNEQKIVDSLVDQYKKLFGQTSVNVCRSAVQELVSSLPQDKKPQFLS